MATIDYKEKYEQALERARQFSEKPYLEDSAGIVEYIFPELKESEDEKIRKEITELVMLPTWETETEFYRRKELVAWLEKQGEQKPTENKGMNLVEEEMTPFQKKVFCIIDTTIEEEQGLKQVCDELFRLAHDEIMQKPAWSEDDDDDAWLNDIISKAECNLQLNKDEIDWLKSLHPQPKQEWKQENTNDLTDFENAMMHIGNSFFGENTGLDPNDTNAIKEQANILIGLVPKQEWSEEDESMLQNILECLKNGWRKLPTDILKYESWLKSLKPQSHWKPSNEQMDALKEACDKHWEPDGVDPLYTLYQDLNKLKG